MLDAPELSSQRLTLVEFDAGFDPNQVSPPDMPVILTGYTGDIANDNVVFQIEVEEKPVQGSDPQLYQLLAAGAIS